MTELILILLLLVSICLGVYVYLEQGKKNRKLEKNQDILVRAVAMHEAFIDDLKSKMKDLELRRRR